MRLFVGVLAFVFIRVQEARLDRARRSGQLGAAVPAAHEGGTAAQGAAAARRAEALGTPVGPRHDAGWRVVEAAGIEPASTDAQAESLQA